MSTKWKRLRCLSLCYFLFTISLYGNFVRTINTHSSSFNLFFPNDNVLYRYLLFLIDAQYIVKAFKQHLGIAITDNL